MDLATGTPDLSGGDPLAGPELSTTEQKKRNRIRFSCTTCREKKQVFLHFNTIWISQFGQVGM